MACHFVALRGLEKMYMPPTMFHDVSGGDTVNSYVEPSDAGQLTVMLMRCSLNEGRKGQIAGGLPQRVDARIASDNW